MNKMLQKNTVYSRLFQVIGMMFSALMLSALLFSTASAHRGARNEVDECRIKVGDERIHFTAYTPSLTGATEYCNFIPNLVPTNFVFDYEGKNLRHITVEFEITKEPEGTRIFYQKPQKIKTGIVNGVIDFSKYGAGDYLAHITIMNKSEKLDSHLPFVVGVEGETSIGFLTIFGSVALFFVIAMLLMNLRNKSKAKQS